MLPWVLNDDKPVLRRMGDTWMVYGTPWSGKHDLSQPKGVPLGGVAFLQRGEENTIRPMTAAEAVPAIISQIPRYLPKRFMEQQLMLLDKFLSAETIWLLTCRNDDDAARVSYEAMKR